MLLEKISEDGAQSLYLFFMWMFYFILGYNLKIYREKHLNITFNDELQDRIKFLRSYSKIIIPYLLN